MYIKIHISYVFGYLKQFNASLIYKMDNFGFIIVTNKIINFYKHLRIEKISFIINRFDKYIF